MIVAGGTIWKRLLAFVATILHPTALLAAHHVVTVADLRVSSAAVRCRPVVSVAANDRRCSLGYSFVLDSSSHVVMACQPATVR